MWLELSWSCVPKQSLYYQQKSRWVVKMQLYKVNAWILAAGIDRRWVTAIRWIKTQDKTQIRLNLIKSHRFQCLTWILVALHGHRVPKTWINTEVSLSRVTFICLNHIKVHYRTKGIFSSPKIKVEPVKRGDLSHEEKALPSAAS